MRELKFLAGLGTILIIGGIYCFKALRQRKVSPEEYHERGRTATKNTNRILLVLAGTLLIIGGVILIGMAFKKTL